MRRLFVFSSITLLLTIVSSHVHTQTATTSRYYQQVSVSKPLELNSNLERAKTELVRNLLKNAEKVVNPSDKNSSGDERRVRQEYSQALMGFKNQTQTTNNFLIRREGQESKMQLLKFVKVETHSNTEASIDINKQAVMEYVSKQTETLNNKLKLTLTEAAKLEVANPTKALKLYQTTFPIYDALNKVVLLRHVSKPTGNIITAKQELVKNLTVSSAKVQMSYREVQQKVTTLQHKVTPTVDDMSSPVKVIAKMIAAQMLTQRPQRPSGTVTMNSFTYENTNIVMPVSEELYYAVKEELSDWNFQPYNARGMKKLPLAIDGEIWSDGDQFRVLASLSRGDTGEHLSSVNLTTPKEKLRGIKIIPDNLEVAIKHIESFVENETEMANSNGLMVELYTDRGKESVSYTDGELMTVYCRVNQPAFIRLLYKLENGRYTVLYENFQITQDNINKDVKIDTYVCAEPYGTEQLTIQARSQKFQPLQTHEEDGYDYLKTSDAAEAYKLLKSAGGVISNLTVTTGKYKKF